MYDTGVAGRSSGVERLTVDLADINWSRVRFTVPGFFSSFESVFVNPRNRRGAPDNSGNIG